MARSNSIKRLAATSYIEFRFKVINLENCCITNRTATILASFQWLNLEDLRLANNQLTSIGLRQFTTN